MIFIPLIMVSCNYFKSSKEADLIPYNEKGKYGYFNLEGKIAINPQFSEATAFREGLALVKTTGDKGKWGFIDRDGKFKINATYMDATVFQDGIAWVVSENGAPTAIDKDGEIQFTLKDAENVELFSEGMAAFSKEDSTSVSWGFVNKSGEIKINPQFEMVKSFSNGKCAVKNKEGKWGYIDESGKLCVNYQFDSADDFEDGKAIVSLDRKAGVIDEDGKYIINPQFDDAKIDDDNYLVTQENKMGWCDKDGKFLINPQFDNAFVFHGNDITPIQSSNKYGYIDKEGKIIINPQFDFASPFFNKVAIVKTGDKFGLIDKEGKYIVNPQFSSISSDFNSYLFTGNSKYGNSTKHSISTDYLDVNAIVNFIDFNNPEGMSLNQTFIALASKKHLSVADFVSNSNMTYIIENKSINKNAKYSFIVEGNAVVQNFDYDSYSYNNQFTNEKPKSFKYEINLENKAYGKSESIVGAIEKKLSGFTLVKKGYKNGGYYVSVYKNANFLIVLSALSNVSVQFLDKNFDLTTFLTSISDKQNSDASSYEGIEDAAIEATPEEGVEDAPSIMTPEETEALYPDADLDEQADY